MSPYRHKQKLLKIMIRLREEVCKLLEDGHLLYPYKSLPEVEHDIDSLTEEIERTGLAK
jgi:hypothetical protein